MKKIALAILVILAASAVQASSIYDIQTGAFPEGNLSTPCNVVVTAVTDNGIFVAEEPYGEFNGIWVYTGNDEPHGMVPGDVVCICGEYKEYFDLSEIDIVSAGIYGSLIKVGTQAVPTPTPLTAAELAANSENWESCAVTVIDGMSVSELLSFGEWNATAEDGNVVRFDDIWYPSDTVVVGDCYDSATGIYFYSYGNFKLEAYEDGIDVVDCSVPTEEVTFDAVKALYR